MHIELAKPSTISHTILNSYETGYLQGDIETLTDSKSKELPNFYAKILNWFSTNISYHVEDQQNINFLQRLISLNKPMDCSDFQICNDMGNIGLVSRNYKETRTNFSSK